MPYLGCYGRYGCYTAFMKDVLRPPDRPVKFMRGRLESSYGRKPLRLPFAVI